MCLSFAALTVWTSPAKPAKWMHVLAGGLVAYAALFTGSRKMLLVLAIVGFVALGWMVAANEASQFLADFCRRRRSGRVGGLLGWAEASSNGKHRWFGAIIRPL